MKCAFIDLGGHNGSSVRLWREKYDKDGKCEVHSFEPLVKYISTANYPEWCILHERAAWVIDGVMPIYLSTAADDGSTLVQGKITGRVNYDRPVAVKCIDFASWLKRVFSSEDKLFIKMNIEGAEYAIIEHMIETGAMDMVDYLFVQWHWWKVCVQESYHRSVVAKLSEYRRLCVVDLPPAYKDFGEVII